MTTVDTLIGEVQRGLEAAQSAMWDAHYGRGIDVDYIQAADQEVRAAYLALIKLDNTNFDLEEKLKLLQKTARDFLTVLLVNPCRPNDQPRTLHPAPNRTYLEGWEALTALRRLLDESSPSTP